MTGNQDGVTGWVLAGLASVVSTLSGLVAFFYRSQIADYKEVRLDLQDRVQKLDDRATACEEDRGVLKVRCAVLESRMDKVEEQGNDRRAKA